MNGDALYKTINMILGSSAYQSWASRKAKKEAAEVNRLVRSIARRIKLRKQHNVRRNTKLNERRKRERRKRNELSAL